MIDDSPWFEGREVARMLHYQDTKQAIKNDVDDADKQKIEDLRKMRCVRVGGRIRTPLALEWHKYHLYQ